MAEVLASAPGKLMWAGEYAVLYGATAVVAAVDRRVVAASGPARGPLLDALIESAADDLKPVLRNTAVDSSALHLGSDKLGLGSSAAAVVAAAARALAVVHGRAILEDILDLASNAHARLQSQRGVSGSGVDVIACAVGGLVAATKQGSRRTVSLPPDLHWSTVFSGQSADTVDFIAKIERFRQHDPAGHERRMDALASSADAFLAAPDASSAVAALDTASNALTELAETAGVALELPIHRQLRDLARRCGGTAKATGAGGGDVILAVFSRAADRDRFDAELRQRGLRPLGLAIDPRGAEVQFK